MDDLGRILHIHDMDDWHDVPKYLLDQFGMQLVSQISPDFWGFRT